VLALLVTAACGTEPSWMSSAPTSGPRGSTPDPTSPTVGDEEVVPPPLLYGTTYGGVVTWDPESGAIVSEQLGTHSPDWSTLASTDLSNRDQTLLRVTDARTGSARWSATFPGALEPRVLSHDGGLVALLPPPGTATPSGAETVATPLAADPQARPYPLFGRSSTEVVVARADGSSRTYHVDANVEPEAFSLDEEQLFVIQYSPATAPTGYRVRQLDLATGALQDMETPHAELLRDMPGSARRQLRSPDGKRLYTLYTERSTPTTPGRSFVHVLDLDEEWAHCVDLPPAFARGSQASGALAIANDSQRLFVADAENRALALVDPTGPLVVKEAILDATVTSVGEPGASPAGSGNTGTRTLASVAPDGTLFVGWPGTIGSFDPHTLRALEAWSVPDPTDGILALDASTRPGTLYLAGYDSVAVIETHNHRRARTLARPASPPILLLGSTDANLARISGALKT